jgi:hypothetical protein
MATPAPALQGFVMQHQEQHNWCWAAVAASIQNFFNSTSSVTQSQVATRVLPNIPGGCGTSPNNTKPACNLANSLTAVLNAMHRLAANPILRRLNFTEVRQTIDAGFPIPVRIVWEDDPDTAHVAVITGYISGAVPQVQVDDPFYGRSVVDLQTLASAYQGVGMWERTYPVLGGQQ